MKIFYWKNFIMKVKFSIMWYEPCFLGIIKFVIVKFLFKLIYIFVMNDNVMEFIHLNVSTWIIINLHLILSLVLVHF
jgi:hypothetical protein